MHCFLKAGQSNWCYDCAKTRFSKVKLSKVTVFAIIHSLWVWCLKHVPNKLEQGFVYHRVTSHSQGEPRGAEDCHCCSFRQILDFTHSYSPSNAVPVGNRFGLWDSCASSSTLSLLCWVCVSTCCCKASMYLSAMTVPSTPPLNHHWGRFSVTICMFLFLKTL